jgi:hypothetical protein
MTLSPRLFSLLGISVNPLSLAKDIANAFATATLNLFGKGATALVTALLGFIAHSSDPDFSGGWWSSSGQAVFGRVLEVSGSLLALAFMCSIITALISADHAMLARAALRLPLAVLEMALLVGVTAALVAASDEVSVAIASGATKGLSTFVAGELTAAIVGTGIVGLIAGGLVILAALAVWAELICRSALIYLVVMAGPLIFAASVHPSVRGLQRRYVEGALALICSKIVIALAFATGAAMLSGLGSTSSFATETGALLEALAVLLVACFAPFVLLRLLLGAEAIVAAEGLERRPARAAVQAASIGSPRGGIATMARGLTGGEGMPPGFAGGASRTPQPPPPGPQPPAPHSPGPSGNGSGGPHPRPSGSTLQNDPLRQTPSRAAPDAQVALSPEPPTENSRREGASDPKRPDAPLSSPPRVPSSESLRSS